MPLNRSKAALHRKNWRFEAAMFNDFPKMRKFRYGCFSKTAGFWPDSRLIKAGTSFLTDSPKGEWFMVIPDIRSRWNEVKGRLKEQYQVLSDDDLALRFGQEGNLLGRLQKKLGKTKADILRIIAEA